MRWLKHLSMAHEDEKLSALLEEFGLEAFGMYWLLLELISSTMEKDSLVTSLTHSELKWSTNLHTSVRKLRKYLESMANLHLISIESIDNRLRINVPKLLKYRDEWSNRSGVTPESLGTTRARVQLSSAQHTSAQHKEPLLPSPKNGSGTAHGSRLSISELPDEWKNFAMADCGWDEFRAAKTFEIFKDYWGGKPGAAGRKSDWMGTWRNWCRREEEKPALLPFHGNGKPKTAANAVIRRPEISAEESSRLIAEADAMLAKEKIRK